MVLLRDGRTLIGYLKSVDQFANIVLQSTIERIHVGQEYGDIPRGIFIVRGENVVLLGEIVSVLCVENIYNFVVTYTSTRFLINTFILQDIEKEKVLPLKKVTVDEILDAQRREQESKQEQKKRMNKALKERGFSYIPDLSHDDMY